MTLQWNPVYNISPKLGPKVKDVLFLKYIVS